METIYREVGSKTFEGKKCPVIRMVQELIRCKDCVYFEPYKTMSFSPRKVTYGYCKRIKPNISSSSLEVSIKFKCADSFFCAFGETEIFTEKRRCEDEDSSL